MEGAWNPWHGCRKYSEGCLNCYVYRRDEAVGRDASQVARTKAFRLPVERNRAGEYRLPPGSSVMACMTSDFFLPEADPWREEAWSIIRERADVAFTIITKRIVRVRQCLPPDWGEGYENVTLCCTIENQRQCGLRLPLFLELPLRHRRIICEPLLGPVDLSPCLDRGIEAVIAGGESGEQARVCDFAWILDLRRQCLEAGVPFLFKQTGALFRKDGRLYRIARKDQHAQARKAGINTGSSWSGRP